MSLEISGINSDRVYTAWGPQSLVVSATVTAIHLTTDAIWYPSKTVEELRARAEKAEAELAAMKARVEKAEGQA